MQMTPPSLSQLRQRGRSRPQRILRSRHLVHAKSGMACPGRFCGYVSAELVLLVDAYLSVLHVFPTWLRSLNFRVPIPRSTWQYGTRSGHSVASSWAVHYNAVRYSIILHRTRFLERRSHGKDIVAAHELLHLTSI